MAELEMKTKFEALYIEPVCLKKIQYWADAADGEVSGLGIVDVEDGKYIVNDVFILEQECSGADTELNPEAISKLMTDIIKAGKDPGKLKFWWHSHVNMGVFWSGTDDECAETLSTEYAFSLVVNKSKDRRVRLDLYKPFRITVDHLRLIELSPEDKDLKDACEKDVKDKVKTKGYTYHGNQTGRGYFRGNYNYPRDEFDEDDWWKKNYGLGKNQPDDERRPKGWGKRVKLNNDEVDDIDALKAIINTKGFCQEAIREFIKESLQNFAKAKLDDKAGCSQGLLTYMENAPVCKNCKIGELCKKLTERFGDEVYRDPVSDKDDGSIEVVVDNRGEGD